MCWFGLSRGGNFKRHRQKQQKQEEKGREEEKEKKKHIFSYVCFTPSGGAK
jgi:hypothetical protein